MPPGRLDWNPLHDLLIEATADLDGSALDARRAEAIGRFGFAVPNAVAVDAIREHSGRGVVEIGAGTGYWSAVLDREGIDVVAYDIDPAPSNDNKWFGGTEPWFPVGRADHTIVDDHGDRLLLIVWPTRNETWAADAVERFADAGGSCIAFVGEGPGGRTGDGLFHARLGDVDVCANCAYGVADVVCTCDVVPRWQRFETVDLPRWPGFDDRLYMYRPASPRRRARWWRGS